MDRKKNNYSILKRNNKKGKIEKNNYVTTFPFTQLISLLFFITHKLLSQQIVKIVVE